MTTPSESTTAQGSELVTVPDYEVTEEYAMRAAARVIVAVGDSVDPRGRTHPSTQVGIPSWAITALSLALDGRPTDSTAVLRSWGRATVPDDPPPVTTDGLWLALEEVKGALELVTDQVRTLIESEVAELDAEAEAHEDSNPTQPFATGGNPL